MPPLITKEQVQEELLRIHKELDGTPITQDVIRGYSHMSMFSFRKHGGLVKLRKDLGLPSPTYKKEKGRRQPYRMPKMETKTKEVTCSCGNKFQSEVDRKGSALFRFCQRCKDTEPWVSPGIDETRYGIGGGAW